MERCIDKPDIFKSQLSFLLAYLLHTSLNHKIISG